MGACTGVCMLGTGRGIGSCDGDGVEEGCGVGDWDGCKAAVIEARA